MRHQLSERARRISRTLEREDGVALLLALAFTLVLGIVGTTMTYYATTNQQSSARSSADATAHGLAEAGINNAMSVLSNPANNALTASILPSSYTTANVSVYDNGYTKWWGTFDPNTTTWTLYSLGVMRNPSGGKDVTRYIHATSKVRGSLMQPLNNPSWNYIMATRTGTPGGCDESLDNSVDIQSPLYIMGNLCLNTPSQVTGGPLMVRGDVQLDVNTNVGSSASPINEAHIGGGCSYHGGPFVSPCTPTQKVWANISDANPVALTAPAADFPAWYQNSAPGPHQACTESSGTVPVFDNDAYLNNSVPTVFNLTPSASDYSCIVRNAGGAIVGQLTWNHTTKVLTVYGTIYIDGSVTANYGYANVPVQYNGQGTLYLGGTFLVSNTMLCGGITGSNCDFNAWNPNTEMLVIVANGNGGQVPSGDGIQLVSSYFQGALWATNSIELDTHSQSEGPMMAGSEILGQTVFAHSWPLITTVPVGMPGTPTVYAQPDPPTGYSS
jgi:hypothetical protein